MSDLRVQNKAPMFVGGLVQMCPSYFTNHEGKQFSIPGYIVEASGNLLKTNKQTQQQQQQQNTDDQDYL